MKKNAGFLILLLACSACISKEEITLPTVAGQFIELQTEDETIRLEAIGFTEYEGEFPWRNRLQISRRSSDGLHYVEIIMNGKDLLSDTFPKVFGEEAGETIDLTIAHTTFEVFKNGNCTQFAESTRRLPGTLRINSWNEEDTMAGSFLTTAQEECQLNGTFVIYVKKP